MSDGAESAEVITIRKPKSKRNLRKRDTELHTEDEQTIASQLQEVKTQQRIRARKADATVEVDGAILIAPAGAVVVEEEASTDQPEQKEAKMMSSQFQQQVDIKELTEAEKEKWIQRELERRLKGIQPEEEEKKKKKERELTEEEKLYMPPAEIRRRDDDIVEAGDRWLTGIMEVPLPIQDKLKTIEATEKAKQELARKKLGKDLPEESIIPGNYNANFLQHQKEYAERMREKARKEGAGEAATVGSKRPAPTTDDGQKIPMATDDKVMQQFVKRMKYR